MALCHKWDVKNDFAYVLQFFLLSSDSLGSVNRVSLLVPCSWAILLLLGQNKSTVQGKSENIVHIKMLLQICFGLIVFSASSQESAFGVNCIPIHKRLKCIGFFCIWPVIMSQYMKLQNREFQLWLYFFLNLNWII